MIFESVKEKQQRRGEPIVQVICDVRKPAIEIVVCPTKFCNSLYNNYL